MKKKAMQFLSGLRAMHLWAAAIAFPLLALSFGAQAQLAPQNPNMVQKAQTGVRPQMAPIPACGCPPAVNFNVRMLTDPGTPVANILGVATGRFVGMTQNGCEYAYQHRNVGNPGMGLGEISVFQRNPQDCADPRGFTFIIDPNSCTVPPQSAAVGRPMAGQPGPYTCDTAPTCRLVAGQFVELKNVARVSLSTGSGTCTYRPTVGHIDNSNNNTRAAIQILAVPVPPQNNK